MEIKDVFAELDRVKKDVFLGKTINLDLGEHRTRQEGIGFSIHDISKWQEGEPIENIDWALTLPSWPDQIYKIDRVELRQTPIIAVVDISPSIFVSVAEKDSKAGMTEDSSKLRLLAALIGIFGFTALYFRDPFGVLFVSDAVNLYLSPKLNRGRIIYAINFLLEQDAGFERQKRKENYISGGASNLNAAFEYIALRIKRQCSVVILSDFSDIIRGTSELNFNMINGLSVASNWNVMAVFLDDPKELSWSAPLGTVEVKDAESGVREEIKAGRASNIRARFIKRRLELQEQLRQESRVDSVTLSYGNHFNELAEFLSKRKAYRR